MHRPRLIAKLLAAALACVSALVPLAPAGAAHRRVTTTEIVPGLTLTKIVDPHGPWRIRVLTVDLAQDLTLDVALATDKLRYHERTSSMAQRHAAIAAINGDFGLPSGRPMNAFAMDGELAQTESGLTWSVNFAVSADETELYMKHVREFLVWAQEVDAGIEHGIERVNQGAPGVDELAMFTPRGKGLEKPPPDACSARLYPAATPGFAETRDGVEGRYYVDGVKCKQRPLARRRGTVLSAPIGGTRAASVASLVPGEQVVLGWAVPGWPRVLDTVGGNPMLVKRGEIFVPRTCWSCNPPYIMRRHPRTGVGYDAETRLVYLVTVDGRRPGYSIGMTPYRFAQEFLALGADYALNLDGGGSTTMVVDGKVVNRPSDADGERAVCSALLVLQGEDPGELAFTQAPAPLPTTSTAIPPPPAPKEVWAEVARDGGSTGGLADYLARKGAALSPALTRAARSLGR